MKFGLATVAAVAIFAAFPAFAGEIASSVDARDLPKGKTTPLGLYLTPEDAHAALTEEPDVVFIDVRDPLEINFVGNAEGTDANVPLAFATHDFDPKRGGYAMARNPNFIAGVDAVMAREGRDKDDPVFVMCRSGGRSAAAAAALAKSGYSNVWSIVEGFEGDTNKKNGRRDVNGWQNAGLPWSYKLDAGMAWQPAGER
ncbi:rhodanese-like domain-containing protein [Aurantimonas marina]|uniref:rhodanese-like domain-containing protein n=1 Tax=Aurantimonas marina TaxID=2780508 RepID=UPI0019D14132|nr:rhodanese-like domain-containing protein [Aurantimonas marina]